MNTLKTMVVAIMLVALATTLEAQKAPDWKPNRTQLSLQKQIKEAEERIGVLVFSNPKSIDKKKVVYEALRIEMKNLEKLQDSYIETFDTPAMREARKSFKKDEKDRSRAENEWRKAHDRAEVSGCSPSEEQEMTIDPRATGNWSVSDFVKVRVINTHDFILDSIEDERGQVVGRLCAGGSITLFRQINTWRDGRYVSFQFIAKGHFPDGTLGLARSQTFTLRNSGGNFGSGTRFYTWEIRLRPEYQRYVPRPQPTQRSVPRRPPPTWR